MMKKRSARLSLNPFLDEAAKKEVGRPRESRDPMPFTELYCPYRDYFGLARVVQTLAGLQPKEPASRPRQNSASSSDWSASTPRSAGTPTEDVTVFSPVMLLEDPFLYYGLPRPGATGRVLTNCIAQRCAEKYKIITALGRAADRQVCVFCRNNGESESVYATHNLKAADGRITCPVLRAYTCPICGANGDDAHTIKYCPQNREGGGDRGLSRPHGRLRNATGRRK